MTTDTKQAIITGYLDFITKKQVLPTYTDLLEYDISRSQIRQHFGNLTRLHTIIKDEHWTQIESSIGHEDYIFNTKRLASLQQQFANTKVFIITTAVARKAVDVNLYNTIVSYLKKRNGELLVIACEDIASTKHNNWAVTVDPILKDHYFVADETRLNSNLFISNIKVSAKQILPTTGLSRIGQTNGSYIFASPKQMLEYVATSPQETHPKAVMTTGAVTVPDYNHDKWMSQRTSYIAEHDHVMGGVIVEIVDDRYFHFRHFQANANGEFVDLGVRYFPDGSVAPERTHLYAGDLHAGQTDFEALDATLELCQTVHAEDFIVGDFFDGFSISHHHVNQPLKLAKKAKQGTNSLVEELLNGGLIANLILTKINGSLVMVKGNHDEVLEKYLLSGNYTKDFTNQYVALGLARDYLEGKDPLVEGYRQYGGIVEFDRIVWLSRDDQYKVGNVECGQHGDLGANGSAGTLPSLEKAYGKCIVGHVHSAAIMRGVFRVGTLSNLTMDYNKGPSSWTHTSCLVYPDGSRQLINVINGKCHL